MLYRSLFVLTIALSALAACGNEPKEQEKITEAAPVTPLINYSVIQTYPHDTALFTEGFLMHNGKLYESTGSPEDRLQTRSMIGITDLKTGKFDKKIEIDRDKYFGEGISFCKGKLFQLTYKNQLGFIYDEKSFRQVGQFHFQNAEGWSLTTNDTELIMSDGTDALTFLNPDNQKFVRAVHVTENGIPLVHLNELEYIKGFIYANIWTTNFIVKIDPVTGKVLGKLDLNSLTYEAIQRNPKVDVLNGIAYDAVNDKIYVTGKLWANIYEISFPH